MSEVYGWAGKRLRVDLRSKKITTESLSSEFCRKWLGGRGFNMKVLWDEIKQRVDPLGENNVLCFGVGPLAGTLASTSGRFNVSAKSPLLGALGDSNCGGHFAATMKWAGFDQIIICGKSEIPVYVSVNDDEIEIRDARPFWGKNVYEATNLIKKDIGDPGFIVACIGTAGENLVRFANIMVECCNAVGRTGMGAVMGSKNLKAIAVKGTKGVKIAEPDKFESLVKQRHKELKMDPFYNDFSTYGTTVLNNPEWSYTLSQCKNFQSWELKEINNLSGYNVLRYVSRLKSCTACPLNCHRLYNILSGPYTGQRSAGPEFETVAHLGYLTMVTDSEVLLRSNTLCNDLGLDTMSTGHALANAMEWYQRGIITDEDTHGVKMEWGNGKVQIQMIEKIAKREGFGKILAEGAYNAGRILGDEAMKYVMHVKGMCHLDLRQGYAFALSRITSTRGSDHLRGDPSMINNPEACEKIFGDAKIANPDSLYGKEKMVIWQENSNVLADSLSRCKNDGIQYYFPVVKRDEIAKILSAVTGINWTLKELELVAERIYTLEQLFWVREGLNREHYKLPWRCAKEPIPNGYFKDRIVSQEELDELLDRYFKQRGWDSKTTIPTKDKLRELGLAEIANELDKISPHSPWNGPPLNFSSTGGKKIEDS